MACLLSGTFRGSHIGGLSEAGAPEDHDVYRNFHPQEARYQGEMKAHRENSCKSHSNGGHFHSLNNLSQKTKLVKNVETLLL